jgi:hypothetical protein
MQNRVEENIRSGHNFHSNKMGMELIRFGRDTQRLESFFNLLLWLARSDGEFCDELPNNVEDYSMNNSFNVRVSKMLDHNEERIVVIQNDFVTDPNKSSECLDDTYNENFPVYNDENLQKAFMNVLFDPLEFNQYLQNYKSDLSPSSNCLDGCYTINITSYYRYFFYPLILQIIFILKNVETNNFFNFNKMAIFRFLENIISHNVEGTCSYLKKELIENSNFKLVCFLYVFIYLI